VFPKFFTWFQGYEPASALLAEVQTKLWSPDVEGQTRRATMQAAEAFHELAIESVQTQRQTAVAEKEESRADALQTRIQHEKVVLKQMKAELVRTLERAAVETRRAEVAEMELANTKVREASLYLVVI
jgi:uncharacterized protein (DUF342 family)